MAQAFFSLEGFEGKVRPEFGPESSKIREKKTMSLVNAKSSEIFNKNRQKNENFQESEKTRTKKWVTTEKKAWTA